MSNNGDFGDVREKLGEIRGLITAGNSSNIQRFNDLEARLIESKVELNAKISKAHDRIDSLQEKHNSLKEDYKKTKHMAIGAGAAAGLAGGGAWAVIKSIFSVLR